MARRGLGHTARDNPSEKIKSKWDKGERPNFGDSLGPRSVGPVSSADKSPGVRSGAPAVVSSEESVLLLLLAFVKVELPASKVQPMLIPFEGLAGTYFTEGFCAVLGSPFLGACPFGLTPLGVL